MAFIDVIGWVSTVLVVLGYYFNSKNQRTIAFCTWISGDVGWIVYDIFIDNWSHMALSFFIIFLNLYGIYNNDSKRISKTSK
jgi:hypothetical protein